MFPVIFDLSHLPVMLVGNDERAVKRLRALEEGGAQHLRIFSPAPSAELSAAAGERLIRALPALDDIARAALILVVGLEETQAEDIARRARELLIPVNVEDVTHLCDFHFPAMVRRGDLLLTVSTGGQSPTLARLLRDYLAAHFGPEWEGFTQEVAALRNELKAKGASMQEVLTRTGDFIDAQGWLRHSSPLRGEEKGGGENAHTHTLPLIPSPQGRGKGSIREKEDA